MSDIMEQTKAVLGNKVAMGVIIALALMGKIVPLVNDLMWLAGMAAVALAFNAKLKTSEITKPANVTEAAGNVVAFGIIFTLVCILQSMGLSVLNTDGILANLKLGVAATAISEAYGMITGKLRM